MEDVAGRVRGLIRPGPGWEGTEPWFRMSEVELYGPIKGFLEAQGYAVKGEIGPCDIVAVRGDEGPVVVPLEAMIDFQVFIELR